MLFMSMVLNLKFNIVMCIILTCHLILFHRVYVCIEGERLFIYDFELSLIGEKQ